MGNANGTSKLDSKKAVYGAVKANNLEDEYQFSLDIPTPEVWVKLATQGSDRVFSRTTMVKAVVQHFYKPSSSSSSPSVVHTPVIYYLNSQVYQTHLPFCANICHALTQHLEREVAFDSREFNFKNYKQFPRQFVLLSIVFYAETETFGVELWPGDNLPPQAIKETHELLQSTLYFGDRLKWRVASPLHDANFQQVDIPQFYPKQVLFDADLFSNVTYQPLHMGISYGICRIWRNSQPSPVRANPLALSGSTSTISSSGSSNTSSPMPISPLRMSQMLHKGPIEVDEHGAPVVDRRTILVAELLPLDLNPLRALVTCQLQTPLCHVALLCANRGTPNMALRTGLDDFAEFDGKLIKLVVNHGDYTVSLADEAEETLWNQQIESYKAARKSPALSLDTSTSGLVLLKHVRMIEDMLTTDTDLGLATSLAQSIGSKALNLARFLSWDLQPVNNTGNNIAFVIPFSYFVQYTSQLAEAELNVLQSPETTEAEARSICGVIRQKILEGRIPRDWQLVDMVKEHIEDWTKEISFDARSGHPFSSHGVIFRSSTNCEDLPGFPSAGLYVSEKVSMANSDDLEVDDYEEAFEEAILNVWASVFLDKAYLERREFGIDESKVAMAVLVMPLLSDCVKANGVAVTTNPFRCDLGGNYINIQAGTAAVTDACGGAAPEQVIFIHDGFKELTMEYLSSSSLIPRGEHILNTTNSKKLNDVLSGIHRGFKKLHTPESMTNAADVEFLLLNNDEIVILQARPVRVQLRPR